MRRKREYDCERKVIEKQIEAKATEGQNFTVPDLKTLDEDRPQITPTADDGEDRRGFEGVRSLN